MMDIVAGQLYVVAAPSGGGKTSLIQAVLTKMDDLAVSISHTTRPIRSGEQDGRDYFFVDEQQFLTMVNTSAFVEHARVFDYLYGTSVEQIKERLAAGIDIVLDIDWQGAKQIRTLFNDAVSIFVIPPSIEILEQRLYNRKRDNAEVIRQRMLQAQNEMMHYSEFDYLIVNDQFEQATEELQSIIVSNRLKIKQQMQRQKKLLSFLLS